MRNLSLEEISEISGGELECSVTISKDPSLTCSGGVSDWWAAGEMVWNFLAASPFTVPGIIERISVERIT